MALYFMARESYSSSSLKLELSLASLMFFGPFIKHMISEEGLFDISEEEKKFVKWYILLGSINLGIWIIVTTLWIVSTFFPYQWINILFIAFSISLLWLLAWGSILAFSNIPLTKFQETNLNEDTTNEIQQDNNVLLCYLPILNFYTWYKIHDFESPQTILRESMIIWTIFGFICLSGNTWIISIFLILMIMRVVTLMILWDTSPKRWRQIIDSSFHKNIEEIWWLVLGLLLRTMGKPFWLAPSLWMKQDSCKLPYSYLYDLRKYSTIQWQYFLLLVGTWYLLSTIPTWTRFWFIILGVLLLWWRYIMMALVWKHLPPIPIIDDIFRTVWSIFDHKKQ